MRTQDSVYERLTGRSIVCVGTADWSSGLWTNQQHLMARLARGNAVVFTESLGLRRPTPTARDLRRIVRRVASAARGPRVADGVTVLSPLVLPAHSVGLVRRLNAAVMRTLLRRAMRRGGLGRPILWAYNPHAHELIEALDPELVVYHCVDDVAAQGHVDESSFATAERAIVARADLVLASAEPIAERMRALGARRVAYVPNVADVGRFAAAAGGPEPREMAALPRPRLVFAGAVAAKKLDIALLTELARRHPDWSLVLVGPVGEGDPRGDLGELDRLDNVHLAGERPFAELPGWVAAGDVGLIPYRHNRYTASVFPMKVYEYLGAGLPVVTSRLPALESVEGLTFAEGVAEFEAAVERELREDSPERRAARRRLARSHSWDARVEEIGRLVAACEAP
jgi:glycosyltransferase involved in cell wall biosynthesis